MSDQPTPEEPVIGSAPPEVNTLFSNKVYDRIKWVAMVFLPAFGSLYFGLGPLWELPKVDEVVGTTVVLDTFLGMLLGLSATRYRNDPARFAGKVVYQDAGGREPDVNLILDKNPQDFQGQKEVTFKVVDDTR